MQLRLNNVDDNDDGSANVEDDNNDGSTNVDENDGEIGKLVLCRQPGSYEEELCFQSHRGY